MSDKKELPNVFGDKLARGLIAERRSNHFDAAGSRVDQLIKNDAPRSRNQMYKKLIDVAKAFAGDGLISIKETGKGKDRISTITFCMHYSAGHVDFITTQISARKLKKDAYVNYEVPATISAHALQRCVQSMKTTHLGTLGKHLLAHARQAMTFAQQNKEDWLSILDESVAIWTWYDGESDYYAGRSSEKRFIIMKTIIPAASLDGRMARAYERYKKA